MLNGKISVEKDRRYSVKETCSILGMNSKTLRKYTRAGEIHSAVHAPSGRIFYTGAEIDRFFKCTI